MMPWWKVFLILFAYYFIILTFVVLVTGGFH